MTDLADAGEALVHIVRFWGAVFSPNYRQRLVDAWQGASIGTRTMMILEGAIATIVGLGAPAVIVWLIYTSIAA